MYEYTCVYMNVKNFCGLAFLEARNGFGGICFSLEGFVAS